MNCDYCEEGNIAVDGWHYYLDNEDGTPTRVPCTDDPPREAGA